MKKFKRLLFFLLRIEEVRHYNHAMRLALYYRRMYQRSAMDQARPNPSMANFADALVSGLKERGIMAEVIGSKGFGRQHTYEVLYAGARDEFAVQHCTVCNDDDIIFLDAKFKIEEPLITILKFIPGIDNILSTPDNKCLSIILDEGVDKKVMATTVGNKVNEYILT